MSRSGQTTRLIDAAIQSLFEKGELILFRKNGLSKANAVLKGLPLFVDPDHTGTNMAQNDFVYRVLKRLESEHKNCYTTNMQHSNYIHIKLK